MQDIIYVPGAVIILLIILELFELPDLIARKIRGEPSKSELEQELVEIKNRLNIVEGKLKSKDE